MGWLKFLGFGGAIKAAAVEIGFTAAGLALIAAGLALLIGAPSLAERVPLIGGWLSRGRQAIGAVLIGAGACALGLVAGFVYRATLDQSALLRLEKAQLERVIAQKAADLKSANEIAEAWAIGAAQTSKRAATAEAAILAYQQQIAEEEAANAAKPPDQRRPPVGDRIDARDARVLCGLAGRWAPPGCKAAR